MLYLILMMLMININDFNYLNNILHELSDI